MSPRERQQLAEMTGRDPQGTLAWDPDWAEYLGWLAGNASSQASNS